jgi:hypothetical protein
MSEAGSGDRPLSCIGHCKRLAGSYIEFPLVIGLSARVKRFSRAQHA